jgi:hypothetical protein
VDVLGQLAARGWRHRQAFTVEGRGARAGQINGPCVQVKFEVMHERRLAAAVRPEQEDDSSFEDGDDDRLPFGERHCNFRDRLLFAFRLHRWRFLADR